MASRGNILMLKLKALGSSSVCQGILAAMKAVEVFSATDGSAAGHGASCGIAAQGFIRWAVG